MITNNINGKKYIGKTLQTFQKKRKSQHITEYATRFNENRALYRAFNKYGIDNFTFSVLGHYHEDILAEREKEYLSLNSSEATIRNGICTSYKTGKPYHNLKWELIDDE